ncbi:type VI secretion system Vgr family protein [Burkholderia ubonensis]|uniref:type VI secretion system Vgr family protein n=1 Tax=Burkholderia ubonensis TaxID=101571 RepID=UPI000BA61384|nr:type VI secretion system Vgr family protein [Burkholderia ubonensis]PAJ85520.1 type IV secretion protein Rhs [Burkholderia ubonensis]PAK06326.1 type IV secretion protein Rhs [Burkholderia ubonensis]RQP74121.1 type VI secretion system tip protein VgrG [Burkholderia ubonensis]RQQ05030.1 type VI secretion system tip protein VgrG [Burkholderia ubonensis]
MSTLTQARTLSLSGAALPTYGVDGLPVFVPVRLTGTETIGRIDACRYLVTLRTDDAYAFSPSVTANLDLDKVVGTEVTVLIQLEGKGRFKPGLAGDAGLGHVGAGVREITALVTAARIVGEDRHSILYELELRPWLYRAMLTQDCRIFQDMSVVEITDAVLAKYPYAVDKRLAGAFRGVYPKRDVQRQAFETDWAFLQRLWEEWGIWWWFEHDGGHHRLVLCDTMGGHHPHGVAYETLRYLPPEGKRIDEEHIHALSVTSRLTPGRVTVVDYDYTRPRANLTVTEENPRDTASADGEIYDWGDYSQPLAGASGLAGEPNDAEREARHLARVQLEAKRCAGLRANGKGNLRGLTVGRTFTLTGYPQRSANREYVVVSCALDIEEVGDRAGAGRAYRCETEFELLPANEPFRLERRVEKPSLSGPEKAIVVGPEGQEIWTDKYGRVKVQFEWDQQGKRDEHAGIWLRVLSPWQGADMGATFIPRIGHEVAVTHYYGDPDLPVIAGSLTNAFRQPALDLPHNQAVSVLRGREIQGVASGHVTIDDTQEQIQTQIASDAGVSQLSLGNLRRMLKKKGRADARGRGFDLRTDDWGVVRALKGLFVTTDGQPGDAGHAKDAKEAIGRLTRARELQESLSGLAQRHEAQQRDADQSEIAKAIKARNDAIRGNPSGGADDFPELTESDIVLAGSAGISLAAERGAHIASNEDVAVTSGRHVGLAVGRSLFASVAHTFSLFVHKAGMALVAAAGKVRIEAQSDGIDLTAKQAIQITSTTDSIHLHAAEEIVLHAGSTEVRIGEQGYVVRTAGEHTIYAGSHQTDAAQLRPIRFPVTPDNPGQFAAHFVLMEHDSGFALPNQPYRVTLDDGRVIEGVSNERGETDLVTSHEVAFGTVEVLAASDPDKVIAVNRAAVVRDNTTPYTAKAPNADKRTAKIRGKTASTPKQGATSENQRPAFATCDPLNFGLRFHHFIDGAKQSDVPGNRPRNDVVYPVTKTYTAAIKDALREIEWSKFNTLSGAISNQLKNRITIAVFRVLNSALSTGPFGLPDGDIGDGSTSNGALPQIAIVDPQEGQVKYNMRPDVSAAFNAKYWTMVIQEAEITKILAVANKQAALDGTLKAFADTLYHEARHCQQTFWMMALLQQHPNDYTMFAQIAKVYEDNTQKEALKAAQKAKIHDDVRVMMGLHRMLIFHYYWVISYIQDQAGGAYVKPDVPIAQAEVCKLLRVSPETAAKMVNFKDGYRSQLHEEDAYACAGVVQDYWDRPDRALVLNPGTCTRAYSESLRAIGGGI